MLTQLYGFPKYFGKGFLNISVRVSIHISVRDYADSIIWVTGFPRYFGKGFLNISVRACAYSIIWVS